MQKYLEEALFWEIADLFIFKWDKKINTFYN